MCTCFRIPFLRIHLIAFLCHELSIFKDIHCSIVCKSQKAKAIQISVNREQLKSQFIYITEQYVTLENDKSSLYMILQNGSLLHTKLNMYIWIFVYIYIMYTYTLTFIFIHQLSKDIKKSRTLRYYFSQVIKVNISSDQPRNKYVPLF